MTDAPRHEPRPPTLTGGPLLARNVGMNVAGWALPAVAAVVAVPLLVRGLGVERFGLLALAWTTLGYFGLFDLGLGRAVTHAAGERAGAGRDAEVPGVVWTALAVLVPLGVLGAVLLVAVTPWLMRSVLDVPPTIVADAIAAYRLLAVAVPFVGAAAVLRGTLEAHQRFGLVNAIRIPYGVLLFAGPALALPFSRALLPAVAILVAVRVLLVVALFAATTRVLPRLAASRGTASLPVARVLLSYGGWMTVSNVVSPLMNTFDQFVIGAILGVGFVTYYAGPFELVTKLWLVTAAVYPVFFAAFAAAGRREPERSAQLFDLVLRVMFAGMLLPVLVIVALAPEILTLWLGPAFAGESARVLQILAIAVFVNTLGQGALNLIQALGRPDITGKFHLAELPVYAVLLWLLLPELGIVGAAIAWAARAVADALLLLLASPRILPEVRPAAWRMAAWCVAAIVALALPMSLADTAARVALAALAIPVWAVIAWRGVLNETQREQLAPWRR